MEVHFYTIKDVAKLLSVSEKTVRRTLDSGEMVYYQVGRQKRIAKSDIESYLASIKKNSKVKT